MVQGSGVPVKISPTLFRLLSFDISIDGSDYVLSLLTIDSQVRVTYCFGYGDSCFISLLKKFHSRSLCKLCSCAARLLKNVEFVLSSS
ncbi:hypothetical protein YC2023_076776 [Brassica napus]